MTTATKLSGLSGSYTIDRARSTLGFTARHTIGPRVEGHFAEFGGTLMLDGDEPGLSWAKLAIQADSIQTHDARRDVALRKSFLDVKAYPAITFRSTKVTQTGATTFNVSGNLTMRGRTRPVAVPLELVGTEDAVSFRGSLPLQRKRWSVNWNSATTLLVSDKVLLTLELTAARNS